MSSRILFREWVARAAPGPTPYDWVPILSALGTVAFIIFTLSSVANYNSGSEHHTFASTWWGEAVTKFFGL